MDASMILQALTLAAVCGLIPWVIRVETRLTAIETTLKIERNGGDYH
jgi:hypothetical protein